MNIVITQRGETHCPGSWTASPEDDPANWHPGANPAEALGMLVAATAATFGIGITVRAWPPRGQPAANPGPVEDL